MEIDLEPVQKMRFDDLEKIIKTLRPMADAEDITIGGEDYSRAIVNVHNRRCQPGAEIIYRITFFNTNKREYHLGVYKEEDVLNLSFDK